MAMKKKPGDLTVQRKAQDEFRKSFRSLVEGRTEAGLAYNLVGDRAKLGLSMSELGTKHDKLKKDERDHAQFGGGLYCGKAQGVFVISGFYECMREQFTKFVTATYCYQVEWDADHSKGRTSAKRFWEAPVQDRGAWLRQPV